MKVFQFNTKPFSGFCKRLFTHFHFCKINSKFVNLSIKFYECSNSWISHFINLPGLPMAVFPTFFGSRHPLRLEKFWRHPYVVKIITWGTLICKSPQVWLRTLANPKVGGTPGTFSRHPGWESLAYGYRRPSNLHNELILQSVIIIAIFLEK